MKKEINFLKYRFFAYAVSVSLFVVFSTFTVINGGLNWGIDFAGGVKLTASFPSGTTSDSIIRALQDEGVTASVQQIGSRESNEYVVSTKLLTESRSSEESYEILHSIFSSEFVGYSQLAVETVGPAIGEYLRKSALKLAIIAIIMMMVYLAIRFELKYSFGAVVALVHDVSLAILFCGMFGVEINVPVIAAFLTIFGYSVNDTIVIFDRIRENVKAGSAHSFNDIINAGINQSISRTLLTSITTLFAVLALYIIGGEAINDFALVLLFGIFIGTYSSVYIASPVVSVWQRITMRKIHDMSV